MVAMPFHFKGIVLIHGNIPRVTLFAVWNNGSWSIVNYDVNVNVLMSYIGTNIHCSAIPCNVIACSVFKGIVV